VSVKQARRDRTSPDRLIERRHARKLRGGPAGTARIQRFDVLRQRVSGDPDRFGEAARSARRTAPDLRRRRNPRRNVRSILLR